MDGVEVFGGSSYLKYLPYMKSCDKNLPPLLLCRFFCCYSLFEIYTLHTLRVPVCI